MARLTNKRRIEIFDAVLNANFGGSIEAYGLSPSYVLNKLGGRTSPEAFLEVVQIAKFLNTVRKAGVALGDVNKHARRILVYIGNGAEESDFENGLTVALVDKQLGKHFGGSVRRYHLSQQHVMQRVVEDDAGNRHLNAARVLAFEAALRDHSPGATDEQRLTPEEALKWVGDADTVEDIRAGVRKYVEHYAASRDVAS